MTFTKIRQFGKHLSLDHHSQGALPVAAFVLVTIKAWWSLPGLVLYGIMHIQYGGSGTFQQAPRDDNQTGSIADMIYMIIGVAGLVMMLVGLAIRIANMLP